METTVEMNIIYEVLSGSRAYGLATENADEDIRGIFLPTERQLLGFGYRETVERKPDVVYHSLKKYLGLALKGNPSLLAWLWVRDRDVLLWSGLGAQLRYYRDKFLSKKVRDTFGGYAMSQLKKMEKSYGTERGYALHGERDAASDPYSRKVNFDCKNAQHLVRLLYCGIRLLRDSWYPVYIDDDKVREHLLAIRHGEVAFNEILREAHMMFDWLDYWRDNSSLPDEPDNEWAEDFLVDAHRSAILSEGSCPT